MALSRIRLWFWDRKKEHSTISSKTSEKSPINNRSEMLEPETVKFPVVKVPKKAASSRNIKKKWQSREERRAGKEDDTVFVPSDGESDGSDWSIGWLEPHSSDFLSDDETDDSFAVLVPCYRKGRRALMAEGLNNQFIGALQNLKNEHFSDGRDSMEQWLNSLGNC